MSYIDLHVHSTASDGTCSPAQLIPLASEAGLSAIALTDHDTISGIPEALHASHSSSVEVIPGIELSAVWQEKEIHILGLFLDVENTRLNQFLEQMRQLREERNDEIIRRLAKAGFSMTREELTGENPETVITRAHFARVMVEKHYVSSTKEAFHRYLEPGCPYCPRKERVTPEAAMDILTSTHAFPALAHPLLYKFSNQDLDNLVAFLKTLGLEGLEVYHSSCNRYENSKLKALASKYSLLPTGGSDFNGENKPDIRIGPGRGNLHKSSLLLDDISKRHALFFPEDKGFF